jgi:hypothetical protein
VTTRLRLGLAFAVTALWAIPASAQECKPEMTAAGSLAGPAQSDAERMARLFWQTRVSQTYGSRYADWKAARNQKMECQQQSGDSYQCWATAEPCTK